MTLYRESSTLSPDMVATPTLSPGESSPLSTSAFWTLPSSQPISSSLSSSTTSTPSLSVNSSFSTTARSTSNDIVFGMSLLIIPISFIGIAGNMAVIFITIRYKDMHTIINYSFASLALTDFSVLIVDAIPTMLETLGIYEYTAFGCRLTSYLQTVCAQVTCMTLAYLAYDRSCVVGQPLKSLRMRTSCKVITHLSAIWIVSSLIHIPSAIVANLTDDGSICLEFSFDYGARIFYTCAFFIIFLLPMVTIITCYRKIWCHLNARQLINLQASDDGRHLEQRARSLRNILAVIVVFVVCYVPLQCVHLWVAYDVSTREDSDLFTVFHTGANLLIFLNSAGNPFIYAFGVKGFQTHLRAALSFSDLCRKLRKCRTIRQQRSENDMPQYAIAQL